MNYVWLLAASAGLTLSACSVYIPDPKKSEVTFPLVECTKDIRDLAASKLQEYEPTNITHELKFDDTWVCRTEAVKNLERNNVENDEDWNTRRLEVQALKNTEEEILRNTLEPPFLRTDTGRPRLGIALSGGGTKAAAFGTGVLAGLDDLSILDKADYISSVSGGGYAAYFYYTHKIFPKTRGDYSYLRDMPSSTDLYRDCTIIPPATEATEELRRRIQKTGGCHKGEILSRGDDRDSLKIDNRYQAFLRCQQDVFKPGNCASGATKEQWGIQGEAVIGTILAIPPAFIATTLFDWGYTVSPAARTYRDGIGLAYGSTISELKKLSSAENKDIYHRYPCKPHAEGFALDCLNNRFNPDPIPLEFDELRKGLLNAKISGNAMPFWILNAAAPKRRNIFGWMSKVEKDVTNADIFEMTAVSHGSPRYGYVSAPPSLYNMSVLDSVTASAAFMDPNNLVVPDIARGTLSIGMHLLALDWGQDIPNFNTSNERRLFHKFMPIPFTWLDSLYSRTLEGTRENEELVDRARSVYIRLMDGGNSENLGAFSLIKRKVQNIVISDAAGDGDGQVKDICGLRRRLLNAPAGTAGKYLYIPGLDGLDAHCEFNESKYWFFEKKKGYDLHSWKFERPVLVGCLRAEKQHDLSRACHGLDFEKTLEGGLETRLYIVKPAVSTQVFLNKQIIYEQGKRKIVDCVLRGEKSEALHNMEILNCDSAYYMMANWSEKDRNCQTFPQHGTASMTVDSDENLFAAYRELARQYINNSSISELNSGTAKKQAQAFERDAEEQFKNKISSHLEIDCSIRK